MSLMKKLVLTLSFTIAALNITGCTTSKMNSTVAKEFQGKVKYIDSIGLAGKGASVAFQAFSNQGYNVKELGQSNDNAIEQAKKKSIPYVAIVNPVGTDGAWWDGVFDFSMRVIEVISDKIVWSANAEYNSGGMFIEQGESTKDAMNAMVKDLSKTFPPNNKVSSKK